MICATMDATIGAIRPNNHELIAVNQDLGGTPGNIVDDTGTGLQVWARPLADGSRAVALLNRTDSPATITARWEKVGLAWAERWCATYGSTPTWGCSRAHSPQPCQRAASSSCG